MSRDSQTALTSYPEAWKAYCDGIKNRGEYPAEEHAFRAGWNACGAAIEKVMKEIT